MLKNLTLAALAITCWSEAAQATAVGCQRSMACLSDRELATELQRTRAALEHFRSIADVPAKFRVTSECKAVAEAIQRAGITGFFELAERDPETVTTCVSAPEIKAW